MDEHWFINRNIYVTWDSVKSIDEPCSLRFAKAGCVGVDCKTVSAALRNMVAYAEELTGWLMKLLRNIKPNSL